MTFIETHSKEIAEKFRTTKSKKKTGDAFGISPYAVDTALYLQGLYGLVSPSVLAVLNVKRAKDISRDKPAPASVASPKSKPHLAGNQIVERGIELTVAREWCHEHWNLHPDVTRSQVQKALKDETGEIVTRDTIGGWLLRWKKQRLREESIFPMPRVPSSELTWEDILQAVPDRIDLALLVLDGFTKVIADERQRNSELLKELNTASETITNLSGQVKDITEDRIRLMQSHNELITKIRSGGHFTLDQTRQILVPK